MLICMRAAIPSQDSVRSVGRAHYAIFLKTSEPHRTMITTPARLIACAAAALALTPLSATASPPGGFTLPEPTPTPTPAPEGPADERAGVAIPPRAQPVPQITPAPMLTPEPTPAPRPLTLPPAPPSASAGPRPDAAPVPAATPSATPDNIAPDDTAPNDPEALAPELSPALSLPQPDAPASVDTPSTDSASLLPAWWPWAAGALAGLVLMGGGLLLRRRRTPKAVRLAPPPPGLADVAPVPALPRLDLTLDITGATRSVMMITLHYRLTLANRTPGAVSYLTAAVQLASARRGDGNPPSPGAAQQTQTIDRIGPHQSRSITGTVQLPVSELAIMRQGNAALFIPIAHVTVEGEGQTALTRSFVIGTPSASGSGKLHPILLDTPPGSISGLRAQAVTIPVPSAAA